MLLGERPQRDRDRPNSLHPRALLVRGVGRGERGPGRAEGDATGGEVRPAGRPQRGQSRFEDHSFDRRLGRRRFQVLEDGGERHQKNPFR